MEKVAVSEFRANLNHFLMRVQKGEQIGLTLRGTEIAKLVPTENKMEKARQALKELRKTAVVKDVISPIDVSWDAMK